MTTPPDEDIDYLAVLADRYARTTGWRRVLWTTVLILMGVGVLTLFAGHLWGRFTGPAVPCVSFTADHARAGARVFPDSGIDTRPYVICEGTLP